jgi:hypothetical protein
MAGPASSGALLIAPRSDQSAVSRGFQTLGQKHRQLADGKLPAFFRAGPIAASNLFNIRKITMHRAMLLHCGCDGDSCSCTTPSGDTVRVKLPGTIVCRSRDSAAYVGEDDPVDVDEVVAAVIARIAAERK